VGRDGVVVDLPVVEEEHFAVRGITFGKYIFGLIA